MPQAPAISTKIDFRIEALLYPTAFTADSRTATIEGRFSEAFGDERRFYFQIENLVGAQISRIAS
jgi:hypothetical protein